MSKIRAESSFGKNLKKIDDLSLDYLRLRRVKVSTTANRRKNLTTIKIASIKVSNHMAADFVAAIESLISGCAMTAAQAAKELAENNVVLAAGGKDEKQFENKKPEEQRAGSSNDELGPLEAAPQ
jgi:hypothetical protein